MVSNTNNNLYMIIIKEININLDNSLEENIENNAENIFDSLSGSPSILTKLLTFCNFNLKIT